MSICNHVECFHVSNNPTTFPERVKRIQKKNVICSVNTKYPNASLVYPCTVVYSILQIYYPFADFEENENTRSCGRYYSFTFYSSLLIWSEGGKTNSVQAYQTANVASGKLWSKYRDLHAPNWFLPRETIIGWSHMRFHSRMKKADFGNSF